MTKFHKMTHVGTVNGHSIELRETNRYWVSQNDVKYRKSDGKRVGDDYSRYVLLLESVRTINEIL